MVVAEGIRPGGFWERWRATGREVTRTSFGRLMLAGICDGFALLILIGLARRVTIMGVVAAVIVLPTAIYTTRLWWASRPARTGAPAEARRH